MRYVEVYAEQLSVLQARTSLIRINELGYAFGGMDKDDARTYIRELQVEAGGKGRDTQVQQRPGSPAEMATLVGSKVQLVTD